MKLRPWVSDSESGLKALDVVIATFLSPLLSSSSCSNFSQLLRFFTAFHRLFLLITVMDKTLDDVRLLPSYTTRSGSWFLPQRSFPPAPSQLERPAVVAVLGAQKSLGRRNPFHPLVPGIPPTHLVPVKLLPRPFRVGRRSSCPTFLRM